MGAVGPRSNLQDPWKAPVFVASTGNLTLSGAQTIDGVVTGPGQRVLAKNQTDSSENGIYTAAAGAWQRTQDGATYLLSDGVRVGVRRGTLNAGTVWEVTDTDTWTFNGERGPLNNYAATSPPTSATANASGGYGVGSRWQALVGGASRGFTCVYADATAAIWYPDTITWKTVKGDGTVVVFDGGETISETITIDGDSLIAGDVVELEFDFAVGVALAGGAPTVEAKIKNGATIIADTGAVSMSTQHEKRSVRCSFVVTNSGGVCRPLGLDDLITLDTFTLTLAGDEDFDCTLEVAGGAASGNVLCKSAIARILPDIVEP